MYIQKSAVSDSNKLRLSKEFSKKLISSLAQRFSVACLVAVPTASINALLSAARSSVCKPAIVVPPREETLSYD